MSEAAVFDANNHATEAGWATYHDKWRRSWRSWICTFRGHELPPEPHKANGYSPDNYGRCLRCDAFMQWYVFGQHRFGSYNKEVFEAYRSRKP